jgi:VWFA-related protein
MMGFAFLALLLAQAPAQVPALPPAEPRPPRFASRSDLVVLHVAVTDRDSALVPDLPQNAFTVVEDGHPQEIHFFESARTPVTVGLVIDSSISMHRNRRAVVAAAARFTEASHPDDEMFTINFNDNVWPGLPPDKLFTSDRQELKAALDRTTARGRTALFDALRTSLEHLDHGQRQKKALVVISDGGDNASRTTFDQVLAMALKMNVVIYSISIYDQYNRDGNEEVLRRLAAATGGEAFFPRKLAEAEGILGRIARDIRNGYTIGYVSSKPGAGYRAVSVHVSSGDRRKLKVRSRAGYVAGGVRP